MNMTNAALSAESDQPARVRAARGYCNLTQAGLAAKMGVSAQFIKRVENGKRVLTTAELIDLAEACNVPTWFMFNGWEGPTRDLATLWDRVERLEAEFDRRVNALIHAARRDDSSAA